jgi:hypothetical protein
MESRSLKKRTASIYMMITMHDERFFFNEDYLENNETIDDKIFDDGSGVKCNICNIMRTSVEKWKSHNESKRHELLLRQSRSKEEKEE